ncbi:MAG: hypothetical protein LBV32_01655 [Tannerellaceae bacterium]|jgi:hypothetical protein|nr:hypothetical protein [Tannerellaceae bacterium]
MMENPEVEIRTVETLLDKGVRVEIPAPCLFRWFGKKTFNLLVKRPTSQTLYTISGMYMEMKKENEKLEAGSIGEAHELLVNCIIPVSRIIAYGIASYWTSAGIRNRLLAWYLRRYLNTRQLADLTSIVITLSGVHDFCNTIRLITGLRMTMPKTMSA